MIQAVLIFNDDGKPRLSKYYSHPNSVTGPLSHDGASSGRHCLITPSSPSHLKFEFLKTIYSLTNHHHRSLQSGFSSSASNSLKTNFINLDHSLLASISPHLPLHFFNLHPDYLDLDLCLVYRNYATLFFVFLVDQSESQLGILDLIQVFVESLDKCFKNVCELDLIFNYDKLDLLLNQIILGGIVLDTNVDSIIQNFNSQLKVLKNSSSNLNSANPAAVALHSAFPTISS